MRKLILILCLVPVLAFESKVLGQSAFINQQPVDKTSNPSDYKKNIEVYSIALNLKNQSNSDIARLHLLRGINETALNKYDKAIADYSATIALAPLSIDAYSYRAENYRLINKYQLSINDDEIQLSLIKNDSSRIAVLYNDIAFSERQLGQYSKAIKYCSKAIDMDNSYGAAYANRAELYALSGEYQLAQNDFTKALDGYQHNKALLSILYLERANARRSSKQYLYAINDYSYAIDLDRDNKIAYWNRAMTYDLNGDYQLADEDYSKAISYYKNDEVSLSNLYHDRAQMETRLHQPKKAIEDETKAISIDSKFRDAYLGKAGAYAQNGDHQLSINYYTKAIGLFRDNKHTLSIIYNGIAGEAYFLGDYKGSVSASTSAIAMDATAWAPYLNRGKAYLKQLNKELSMRDFNKVLQMDASKKSYEYAFALFYTGHPDQAIAVLQKNLISTTDSSVLINRYYDLACLFSLMNKPEESNIYLKKCIEAGYPKKYLIADADLNTINRTKEFKDNIHDSL